MPVSYSLKLRDSSEQIQVRNSKEVHRSQEYVKLNIPPTLQLRRMPIMQLKMSQTHTQRTQIGRSSKRNSGNQMNVFRSLGAQGDKSVDPFEICDEQEGEQTFPHHDLDGSICGIVWRLTAEERNHPGQRGCFKASCYTSIPQLAYFKDGQKASLAQAVKSTWPEICPAHTNFGNFGRCLENPVVQTASETKNTYLQGGQQ